MVYPNRQREMDQTERQREVVYTKRQRELIRTSEVDPENETVG